MLSAFGGLSPPYPYRVRPQAPYRGSPLDPTGDFRLPDPSFVDSKKSLNYIMVCRSPGCRTASESINQAVNSDVIRPCSSWGRTSTGGSTKV